MNGEQLKKRIMAAQLTQKELAERLNVKPQTVTSWLATKNIGSEKLELVCKAIGKPINFLYEGTPYYDDPHQGNVIKFGDNDSDVIKSLVEMLKQKESEVREMLVKLSEKDKKIESLYEQNIKLRTQLPNNQSFEKTEKMVQSNNY